MNIIIIVALPSFQHPVVFSWVFFIVFGGHRFYLLQIFIYPLNKHAFFRNLQHYSFQLHSAVVTAVNCVLAFCSHVKTHKTITQKVCTLSFTLLKSVMNGTSIKMWLFQLRWIWPTTIYQTTALLIKQISSYVKRLVWSQWLFTNNDARDARAKWTKAS